MKIVTTTISETVKTAGNAKGTRKEVGKISFLVPTLEEVKDHLNSESALLMAKDAEGKEIDSFDSDFSQFIADSIETACKSKLVSKLEPKSVTFKSGHSAWTTIEELLEQGQRGQHFAIASQFKIAIGTFIAGLKKSDGFKAAVLSFCTNVQALAETTPANKSVVQKVLDGFLETLEEEDVSKFDKLLTSIGQAIEYTGSSLED